MPFSINNLLHMSIIFSKLPPEPPINIESNAFSSFMYFSNISTASPSSKTTLMQLNFSKLIFVTAIAASSFSIEYTTPLFEILEACTVMGPVPEPISNSV